MRRSGNPVPTPTLVSPDNGPGRRSPFFSRCEEYGPGRQTDAGSTNEKSDLY